MSDPQPSTSFEDVYATQTARIAELERELAESHKMLGDAENEAIQLRDTLLHVQSTHFSLSNARAQAKAELEECQRGAAAMREALENMLKKVWHTDRAACNKARDALATDAGKGFVRRCVLEQCVTVWYLLIQDISNAQRVSLPDYLTDLNAAISLCDLLADKGWNCRLGNRLDKTWECEFYRPATEQSLSGNVGSIAGIDPAEIHYAGAATMAQAIYEAFLHTIGRWDDAK